MKVSGYDVETTVADTYAKHIEARMLDVASGNLVPEMQAQADGTILLLPQNRQVLPKPFRLIKI